MRLTLRTLLAYLDDILEPSQAKEIGDKIKETPNAATLVSRIRDVMRKRRITANSVVGPESGVDPNLIAEYLDNTLDSEQVTEVEKICLESDVHLAEVAACHQILTLAFGEPADIDQQTREHMYALGPIKQTTGLEDPATSGTPHSGVPATPEDPVGLPAELKPKPFLVRAIPYIIVSVIAGVWVWTLIDDPSLFPQAKQQDQLVANNPVDPAANAIAELEANQPPKGQTEPQPDQSDEPDMQLPPDETVATTTTPKPSPKSGPLSGPSSTVPTPGTTPSLPDSVPVPKPSVIAPKPEPSPIPEPQPQPIAGLPINYSSREGLLLHWDADLKDWLVMPRRSVIHVGDELASPHPFDSVLGVGPRVAQITLLGETRASILAPSQAGSFGININRGRVVLELDQNAEMKQLTLALGVHKELWRAELLTPETRCGVSVDLLQPEQPNQLMLDQNFTGHLLVETGAVRFSDGKGHVQIVKAGQALLLPPKVFAEKDSDLSDLLPEQTLTMLVPTPENWLSPEARRMTASVKRQATIFENEFEADQPLTFSSSALVKDRRPSVSELAVRCLALTDRHAELVMALTQSTHEESRKAAINGLRNWLPTDSENDALLKAELNKYMMPDSATAVHRLLWGYQKKDAINKLTSEQLVNWLEDSNIAVRELAFLYVNTLTGRTYDYRPLAPANQRASSVKRWRNHLAREGALIKPPMPEPTVPAN